MKETDIIIPFTKEDVKKHLDDMIDFWREKRESLLENQLNLKSDQSGVLALSSDQLVAECYVDAYQCVRKNLFGELKE